MSDTLLWSDGAGYLWEGTLTSDLRIALPGKVVGTLSDEHGASVVIGAIKRQKDEITRLRDELQSARDDYEGAMSDVRHLESKCAKLEAVVEAAREHDKDCWRSGEIERALRALDEEVGDG